MANMQVHTMSIILIILLACQIIAGNSNINEQGSEGISSSSSQHQHRHTSKRDADPRDFDSLEIELHDGDGIDSLEVGDSIAIDFVMHESISAKSGAPFILPYKTSMKDTIYENVVFAGGFIYRFGQFCSLWAKYLLGMEICP